MCPVICMTGRMKVPSNIIPKMVANASAGAIPSSFTLHVSEHVLSCHRKNADDGIASNRIGKCEGE